MGVSQYTCVGHASQSLVQNSHMEKVGEILQYCNLIGAGGIPPAEQNDKACLRGGSRGSSLGSYELPFQLVLTLLSLANCTTVLTKSYKVLSV